MSQSCGATRSKISDGINTASVIARDSATATTDRGVGVVILSTHQPFYQAVTTEITSATTTGTKENLTLWHPNTVTKDVFIVEIGVNVRVVQTAGTFAWEMQYISAENATPGGTTITAQPLKMSDAASGLVIRQVATGAPTVTGQMIQRAGFPLPAAGTPFVQPDAFLLFTATDRQGFSDALILRNGQSEGLRITQNIIAALTTAPVFTVYVKYVERA